MIGRRWEEGGRRQRLPMDMGGKQALWGETEEEREISLSVGFPEPSSKGKMNALVGLDATQRDPGLLLRTATLADNTA